jgi:hypothetical protein
MHSLWCVLVLRKGTLTLSSLYAVLNMQNRPGYKSRTG